MKNFIFIAVMALALTACSGSKKDSGTVDSTENQAKEAVATENRGNNVEDILKKVVGARYQLEAKSGELYEINFGPDNQMLIMFGMSQMKGFQVNYTPDFNTGNGGIEFKDMTIGETDGISKEKAATLVKNPMNIKFGKDFKTIEVSNCSEENMNGTYSLINPEDFPEGF